MADSNKCLCLAVVKENDTSVLIWDTEGNAKTFKFTGDPGKLCFSTHGSDSAGAFLSPCFDEDGLHGDAEESCFCGVETSHIHAHYHDEKRCNAHSDADVDIGYLATLILQPAEDDPLLSTFELSEELPNACNSKDVINHLKVKPCHNHDYSKDKDYDQSQELSGKRLHRVKHDNHYDTLVLDDISGDNLYLEHDCTDCGDTDVHGNFSIVGKRTLDNDVRMHFFEAKMPFSVDSLPGGGAFCSCEETKDDCFSHVELQATGKAHKDASSCSSKVTEHSCSSHGKAPSHGHDHSHGHGHSHELAPSHGHENSHGHDHSHGKAPSHEHDHSHGKSRSTKKGHTTTDCCSSKATKSDCSSHGKPPSHGHDHSHGKSHSTKKGHTTTDCCSSKVTKSNCSSHGKAPSHGHDHSHEKSHSTKKGHTTTDCCSSKAADKNCCVNDNVSLIPATDCCVNDTCTSDITKKTDPSLTAPPPKTVRSTFVCTEICCASEIPAVQKALKPLSGVATVMVNAPMRVVMTDHDPSIITAQQIVDCLNKALGGATIKRDGAAGNVSTSGRSQLFVANICCASEIPGINNILVPLPGVKKVSINTTTKIVYVDHDTAIVTAKDLCEFLNNGLFDTEIRHDAIDDNAAPLTAFVQSTLDIKNVSSTKQLETLMNTYNTNQVESYNAEFSDGKIHVVHNPLLLSLEEIIDAFKEQLSINATVIRDGGKDTIWDFPEVVEEELAAEKAQSYPKPLIIMSGVFWIISMFSLLGGNWEYLKWVAIASVVVGLPPIGIKALRKLRSCQFDTNVLMFTAAIGALALQEFTEAAAVAFLFSISDWLETRATTRARNALAEIVSLRPEKANIIHPATKEIVVIPPASVPVGAVVSVKTGDKIPCDGIIVSGSSTVDESSLTGEHRPVTKKVKDVVSGGTINSGMGELVVRTTASADNSAVAKLIRLVEEAQMNRSATEKMVDEFAKVYTPIVIAVGLGMITIPWAWGKEIGKDWMNRGLVLLVVACPCALIISTPVTYVAGLASTAQRGVLVKGGAFLEALGMIKKIAFDKTGTLTKGEFALLDLNTFGDLTREEVLGYLALVEERASHPISQAIVAAVRNEGISVPTDIKVQNHYQLPGEGISALVGDVNVFVGNERLFRRLNMYESLPNDIEREVTRWISLGGTIGFMSVEGHGLVCAYCCADSPRPEAAAVLKSLKKLGIEVTMLTGDNRDAALAVGRQVGLDETQIQAGLLPEEKLSIINSMKEEPVEWYKCKRRKLIMMCGDGVNDAPALATADIGLAMGAGAALAMETSDITLLDSNLEKLLYSLKMGQRVTQKIRENVIFSFVVKGVVVGFTLSGYARLWLAIVTDVGAMIVVTLNGMTLIPMRKREDKSDIKEEHFIDE